ncbi:MAG: hypothetical protein FWH57_09435, partial [Oscillospiraceae bacterium]|nr:hypothetical protein [Oscillospiraceae bacterium]
DKLIEIRQGELTIVSGDLCSIRAFAYSLAGKLISQGMSVLYFQTDKEYSISNGLYVTGKDESGFSFSFDTNDCVEIAVTVSDIARHLNIDNDCPQMVILVNDLKPDAECTVLKEVAVKWEMPVFCFVETESTDISMPPNMSSSAENIISLRRPNLKVSRDKSKDELVLHSIPVEVSVIKSNTGEYGAFQLRMDYEERSVSVPIITDNAKGNDSMDRPKRPAVRPLPELSEARLEILAVIQFMQDFRKQDKQICEKLQSALDRIEKVQTHLIKIIPNPYSLMKRMDWNDSKDADERESSESMSNGDVVYENTGASSTVINSEGKQHI